MRAWVGQTGERALPWASSLLLHAALLLVIYRGVTIPRLPPPGEEAVEVRLIGVLPGGGKGPGTPRPSVSPVRPASRSSGVGVPSSDRAREGSVEPAVARRGPSGGEGTATPLRDVPPRVDTSASVPKASPHESALPSGEAGKAGNLEGTAADTGAPGESLTVAAGIGGGGSGSSGVGGAGSGGGGGDWRGLLRGRIERAKQYPPEARRQGMEGTTEVQFQIAGDGSVADVTVVKSSGFALLDQASVQTIRRAAPLPFIPGVIRLSVSYRLRDAP